MKASEELQQYLLAESYERFHYTLPNEKPWIYAWTNSNSGHHLWTVVDGVLNDNLTFTENTPAKYWVELISVSGGINNATRWWHRDVRTSATGDESYYQCTDPALNRFVPTGTPGVASDAPSGTSNESTLFTTVEEFRESNLSRDYEPDGTRVVMTRGGSWDVQKLAYKPIACSDYYQSYEDNGHWYWKYNDPLAQDIMFLPPRADAPNSGFIATISPHGDSSLAKAFPWTILEDNTIDRTASSAAALFGRSDWFVLASTHAGRDELHYGTSVCSFIRSEGVLLESAYIYREMTDEDHKDALIIKTNVDTSHCTAAEDSVELAHGGKTCIAESELLVDESDGIGSCDFTSAHLYDGWGWNATTGQPCEPENSVPDGNQTSTDVGQGQLTNTESSTFLIE